MKKPIDYFNSPTLIAHKQFEALRMFFVEKVAGKQVAKKFGYTYRGFTTIVSNFRTPDLTPLSLLKT